LTSLIHRHIAFILHTVAEKLAVVHKLHRRSIGVVLDEALIEIWKAILCMNKLLELGTVSAGHPLTTKVSRGLQQLNVNVHSSALL